MSEARAGAIDRMPCPQPGGAPKGGIMLLKSWHLIAFLAVQLFLAGSFYQMAIETRARVERDEAADAAARRADQNELKEMRDEMNRRFDTLTQVLLKIQ